MEPTDFNGNLTMTDGLPLGFAMGMAMNQQALDHYGKLTEYEGEADCRKPRSEEQGRDGPARRTTWGWLLLK